MSDPNRFTQTADGFLNSLLDVNLALTVGFIALAIASAGAVVGFLTRKVLTLLGVFVAFGLLLQLHTHLPFPPEVDAQIMSIRTRLWPW